MTSVDCESNPCSSNNIVGMTSNGGEYCKTVYVRAKYSFEGRNNDELSFRKDDIITVSQQLDGGWWEGTLKSCTGWFPSDYVAVTSDGDQLLRKTIRSMSNVNLAPQRSDGTNSHFETYRQQVVNDFLECERSYANSLSDFYNDILLRIERSNVLSDIDFSILSSNIPLLVIEQNELFEKIRKSVGGDGHSTRIGGILLGKATTLRKLLQFYYLSHPKAVDIVLKNRTKLEKFLLEMGHSMKDLISELSQPFRHIENYSAKLTEMERSLNDGHPDRGDVQRAASVFRDISAECSSIRKQKEMQLEFVSSSSIQGLTRDEMERFGEVILMGVIGVTSYDSASAINTVVTLDRCVVLFDDILLVLEITSTVNKYNLMFRIPTSEMTVRKGDCKNLLSVLNGDGERVLVLNLTSKDEWQRWIGSFISCEKCSVDESCSDLISSHAHKIDVPDVRNVIELSPVRKPEISNLPVADKAHNLKKIHSLGLRFDHKLEMILPECGHTDKEDETMPAGKGMLYSGFCLRPYPSTRGNYGVDCSRTINVKLRKEVLHDDQDTQLLRIIEGYCTLSHLNRSYTQGQKFSNRSVSEQPPQLIVADDEKILVEEIVGDEVIVHEKSLVDTVYALKDHITFMQKEMKELRKVVEQEQKARRRIEEFIRQLMKNSSSYSDDSSMAKSAVGLSS